MTTRLASLAGAILTNVFLVWLFASALTNPVDFKSFIYRTGLMIFMIEFMSLHSSGMFFGAAQKADKKPNPLATLKAKIGMIAFYSVFVVGFAAGTGQWLAAVYFVASLAGKAFFSRSVNTEERMAPVAAGIVMLLLSTFVVVFTASLLKAWFPFPAEVRSARPPGQSGLFIDTPQTLMMWGVLYFSLMTLCEVLIFRKSWKRSRQRHATPTPQTD